jgi:hypothetical protein
VYEEAPGFRLAPVTAGEMNAVTRVDDTQLFWTRHQLEDHTAGRMCAATGVDRWAHEGATGMPD